MKVEDNTDNWQAALKSGAFVQAHLNASPNVAFIGFVRLANEHRISMVVHEVVGPVEVTSAPCLAWMVYLPVASVAWVRHLPGRPSECDCRDESEHYQ